MSYKSPAKKYGVLAFAAVVAIVVSFLFAAKGTLDRRTALADQQVALRAAQVEADKAACLRINKVYRLIQTQLTLSLQTTPKLSYYKHHPAELRRVQRSTRVEIKAFTPEKC